MEMISLHKCVNFALLMTSLSLQQETYLYSELATAAAVTAIQLMSQHLSFRHLSLLNSSLIKTSTTINKNDNDKDSSGNMLAECRIIISQKMSDKQ